MASRIKLSALALMLFLSGVLAVCGDRSAAAQPLTHEITSLAGGWKARANFDSNGKLRNCIALRITDKDKEGVQFGVAALPDNRWGVMLNSSRLEPNNKPNAVDVTFDGQVHYHLSALQTNAESPDDKTWDHAIVVPLQGYGIAEQFRKSETMSMSFQGQSFSFSLAGTSRLFPVLMNCVRTYANLSGDSNSDRPAPGPLTKELTNVGGGWAARANFDSDGKLSTCMAIRHPDKDGMMFGVAALPNNSWGVTLLMNSWNLELSNKPRPVDVAFGGQARYHVFAVTTNRNGIFIPLQGDEMAKELEAPDDETSKEDQALADKMAQQLRSQGSEMAEQFRKSENISILFQGQNFYFSLAGTSRLLPAVMDCVRTYANRTEAPDAAAAAVAPVAARPPDAAPAAARSPSTFFGGENVDFRVLPQNTLQSAVGKPTPLAIPGAATVTTTELMKEMQAGRPMILIDVLRDEHDTTIKGAVTLPYAGAFGSFHDQVQTRLANALNSLLQGRADVPLIFFCHGAKCWESYNAALRARAAGFQNVSWYRGGLAAWREAGFPMQPNQ
jgi:PQQ-dependent catabolism-associated CXXCW motif protein